MERCRNYERLCVEASLGDIGDADRERLEQHVRQCNACARALAELRSTLATVAGYAVPEPSEAYWDGYYDRLVVRMEKDRARAVRPSSSESWYMRLHEVVRQPGIAIRLAITVGLLLGTALLGRMAFNTRIIHDQPIQEHTSAMVTDLASRTDRYLERTKVLLLSLENFDPETDDVQMLHLKRQRQISRELLREGQQLRAALQESEPNRLQGLISGIELVLLQLSNLETTAGSADLALIRHGIERKGLLMQINLEELQREDREPVYQ